MQSKAATVEEYLANLPEDRRVAIQAVRKVILDNLDKDYSEGMQYGMIGYAVPHSVFPAGYHCDPGQPLTFAGLASQKNYMAIYLMCIYGDEKQRKDFEAAYAKTGKKLDMGKSCIRFKRVEDLALNIIGDAIARVPARLYVERYEAMRRALAARPVKGPPAGRKAVAKAKGRAAGAARRASKARATAKTASRTRKKGRRAPSR